MKLSSPATGWLGGAHTCPPVASTAFLFPPPELEKEDWIGQSGGEESVEAEHWRVGGEWAGVSLGKEGHISYATSGIRWYQVVQGQLSSTVCNLALSIRMEAVPCPLGHTVSHKTPITSSTTSHCPVPNKRASGNRSAYV